jgi:TctA family transporter
MIITETQRFVYSLLALTFVTIVILVLFNVYALEIFLVLIIIEFLALVELTKPSVITMAWRKNIVIFVVICVIVFAIIYERTVSMLP